MHYEEFLGQVQHRAQLPGLGKAAQISRATLETLAERVPEGLADNLAAQLPVEIGEHLRRTEVYGGLGSGAHYDRKLFVDLVASRAGVDPAQVPPMVRSVTEVVDEAVQGALMTKIKASLPADIAEFVAGDDR